MKLIRSLSADFKLSGDLYRDIDEFLILNRCPRTAQHCQRVSVEAEILASRFGVDPFKARLAGMLHDCSAVIPSGQRLEAARSLGLPVLVEEERYPMILHQKLSAALAREIFNVMDLGILSAVACHTTLKIPCAPLDKVIFIADKLAWDQAGEAPYHPALREAVQVSLDNAVRVYLAYLWNTRNSLPVLHPWMLEAYEAFCA